MEPSEISRLLPLYVAGSATHEEKHAVEEALKGSKELRDELEFWKHMRQPAVVHDPRHPPAEMIVDYVEGTIAGPARPTFESHLRTCATCQGEVKILRETYPAQEPVTHDRQYSREVSMLDLLTEFFRTIRTVYAAPAALLVVICAFVVVSLLIRGRESPPITVPQALMPAQPHRALVLAYLPRLRSTSKREPATLTLSPADQVVDVTLFVPRSVDSVTYSLSLVLPSDRTVTIPGTFTPRRYDNDLDSVIFSLDAGELATEGEHTITATELMPGSTTITPETHEYPFVVSKRR